MWLFGGGLGCVTAAGIGAAIPPTAHDAPEGNEDYASGYNDGYAMIVRRNRALAALGGGAATTAVAAGAWFILSL